MTQVIQVTSLTMNLWTCREATSSIPLILRGVLVYLGEAMTRRPMSKVQHRLLRKYYLQGQGLPLSVYDPTKDTPQNTNPLNALLARGVLTRVAKSLTADQILVLKKKGLRKAEINFRNPAYYNTQKVVWWAGGWRDFSTFTDTFLYSLTPTGVDWCEKNINHETLEIIYRPSRNPYGCCRKKPTGDSP